MYFPIIYTMSISLKYILHNTTLDMDSIFIFGSPAMFTVSVVTWSTYPHTMFLFLWEINCHIPTVTHYHIHIIMQPKYHFSWWLVRWQLVIHNTTTLSDYSTMVTHNYHVPCNINDQKGLITIPQLEWLFPISGKIIQECSKPSTRNG